ncbi:unnamed protein product, partial [Brassica oleracea]
QVNSAFRRLRTIGGSRFGSPPNTLTEPVWDTVKSDLSIIMSNLKLVVFPNPNREDLGKAFRDWDPWGPFFFIVFLGLTLSWSASRKKAKASLDSELLLAFDLTQRTDSQLMCMIRYEINHIVKFTIKCCSHVRYVSKTMVLVGLSDIHA